jgi:hypothetical protein
MKNIKLRITDKYDNITLINVCAPTENTIDEVTEHYFKIYSP